ncbi:MAG: outer membrane beta-barrel protein [Desulfuromonadaceae bacterium]|nr:outer membrane beta-barrel protein [Desulfuromonadaceae bacterium]
MNKYVFLLICLLVNIFIGSSVSFAEMYVSSGLNAGLIKDSTVVSDGAEIGEFSYEPSIGLVFAIGGPLEEGRVEVEIGYRTSNVTYNRKFGSREIKTEGDCSLFTVMGNSFYDIPSADRFFSYIGVGLGFANIKIDSATGSDNANLIAYQIMLGEGYEVTKTIIIDLQYRFFGTSDPRFSSAGTTIESKYLSHNILVGLRYNF